MSQCVKAGQGVIAAATFAMLFGLLSIIFLHIHTSFKQWCNCRVPFPRVFVALWSFLSLTLYVVMLATCQKITRTTHSANDWRDCCKGKQLNRLCVCLDFAL